MSLTTSDAHRTKLKDFVSPVNVKNILEATDVCVKRSVITGIHTEELYDTLHSSWPARTITPADDNYTFMCGRHKNVTFNRISSFIFQDSRWLCTSDVFREANDHELFAQHDELCSQDK